MSEVMPKSRSSAFLYLSLVFLSGALVGGLSYRLYAVNSVNAITATPRPSPEEFRKRFIESIRTKVNLDEQQVQQVEQIMDEARGKFDEVRAKSRAEMDAIEKDRVEKTNAILRDDQKPLYAEFRAEREKIRQQNREKQKK
jgi:hypothetical protein